MSAAQCFSKTVFVKLSSSTTFCFYISAIILTLVVLNTVAVHGAQGSHQQVRGKAENKHLPAPSCFDTFSKCWNISACRNAYRGLRKRCKVINGRCSASMVDLPRCAQIMDTLFAEAFTKRECSCDHDKARCFELRNRIYHNHCFDKAKEIVSQNESQKTNSCAIRQTASMDLLDGSAKTVDKREYVTMSDQPVTSGESERIEVTDDASIDHLRTNKMFPNEVTAFDKASGYTPPKSTQIPAEEETRAINGEGDIDDYIFGDGGFAERPPSKKLYNPPKSHKDLTNGRKDSKAMAGDHEINYEANREQLDLTVSTKDTTAGSRKTTEPNLNSALGDKLDFDNDSTNEYREGDPESNKIKSYTEKHLREQSTNFKVIAIILGCLLVVFIVLAITFFAWLRLHGGYFYTSGKIVRDHRKQEGTHHRQSANHYEEGKLKGMA